MDDMPEESDDFLHSDLIITMLAKEYGGTDALFTSSAQLGYLKGIAAQNHAWLMAVNLVGAQDESIYDGGSIVLDASGAVKDYLPPFAEEVMMINLDLEASASAAPTQADSATELHLKDAKIVKPLLPYEADWNALVCAIRDFVGKNGFSDVVLGLSGGIDSALVAALATEALGSSHVHGVCMPGPFSSQASIDDAQELARLLGIETLTFPIVDSFEAFKQASIQVLGGPGSDTALENLQARLRTLILMHLSNSYGWLVLNTGNKSEAAMGYSTLYGDTAGAFAPLGNLYKTDVYGIAAWLNEKELRIPQAIIDKAPSAELREGQLDTDSLPPYDVLDRILKLHIEENLGVDQILECAHQHAGEAPLDSELIESVLARVKKAEFKRRQEPLAPILGGVDMCKERWWPLTNGFNDRDRHLFERSEMYDYLSTIFLDRGPSGVDLWGN
jgi:NAD+ synthase (glutamine-hydrolysing)